MKIQKTLITSLIAAGFIFWLQAMPGEAQTERILDYYSDIALHENGSMTVTETIEVVCAGQEIQRGIYRTFPTRYKDRHGNTIRVSFDVMEILKNGEPEPYHIEKMGNGVKVYIGSRDVFLDYGEYTYTLVYRTDRQVGFFDDFDELYWNVTGADWGFVIEQATAVVRLPSGAEVINTAGYTGPQGAKGRDYSIGTDQSGNVCFMTTRPLSPYEGLTLAVSFTKGIIPEPTFMEKTIFVIKDNPSILAAVIGFCVLLLYYVIVWSRVGKDPPKGTIVPRFSPPTGYSPAATRFVMRMGYSDRIFAAAVVNMAVKGAVSIHEEKGKFSLSRTKKNESLLAKIERQIADKLFASGDTVEFEQKNHLKIQAAIQALKTSLKLNFEKMNFRRNVSYLFPGIVLTLLTLVAIVFTAQIKEGAGFISLWLTGWTAGCMFLTKNALNEWRSLLSRGGPKTGRGAAAVVSTLFALPFLGFEIFGLWIFSTTTSPLAALLLLFLVFVNIIFYELLKAPTIYGRKIMDEIEGFKMYLEAAEEERLKILHPPDKTPELFEKYLPYALALNVENAWSEKFSDVLAKAGKDQDYSPAWYSGMSWNTLGISGLTSSLGSSFSSAISSSSTAPGSSSGSSGGGSSGGGGGGGGGGGW
jgi:uncharacterized membrane protein YgcG